MRPGGGFSLRLDTVGCLHPPAVISHGGDDVANVRFVTHKMRIVILLSIVLRTMHMADDGMYWWWLC